MKRDHCITITGTVVFLVLAFGLGTAYFRGSPAGTDGSSVDGAADMSVAEAGHFTGAKYRETRQQHLKNAARYQLLPFVVIPAQRDTLASALLSTLQRRLASKQRDQAIAATLSPEVLKGLSMHLALLLQATAGLGADDYLKGLPDSRVLRPPPNVDAMNAVLSEYGGSALAEPNLASPKALRDAFERLAKLGCGFRSGGAQVVDWSADAQGLQCSIDWIRSEQDSRDLLWTRLPRQDLFYWYGMLAQAAFIFNQPPYAWRDVLRRDRQVLWSQAIIVVRSRDGDVYPLHVQSWYDSAKQTWWLEQASRRSSIRAANGPPLAF
jgi:hypothetical protein